MPINTQTFNDTSEDSFRSPSFIREVIKYHMDKGEKPNRLINEKSPYLLQHAFNPVEWYSWSDSAFDKSKSENKLIFLSIGYSTCYWCHVMEREVFENERIASLMNEYFVNIKVDREEHPEIDRIYMKALSGIAGSGGWPMSMFLTPDLKPFYGATYIPPTSKYGRPGFPELIKEIHDQWLLAPEKFYDSAKTVTNFIKSDAIQKGGRLSLSESTLKKAFENINSNFDHIHKGFGNAPKFPRPMIFNFLFRYYKRFAEETSKIMALDTLKEIAFGGIHDQIGGGFHRYSTDNKWRIPHFEKMLYDQAQLTNSYLDAFQITRDDLYSSTAGDTLEFIISEMTSPEGGFYSAIDAESAVSNSKSTVVKEGAYYLWGIDEIQKILTSEEFNIFCFLYGFEEIEDIGSSTIKQDIQKSNNIIYQIHSIEETAKHLGLDKEHIINVVIACKNKLLSKRKDRPYPHLDDKILTSWNGLMISAFSNANKLLRDDRYIISAERSADFILNNMYDQKNNILFHRYRDKEAKFEGGLEDYVFFINSLIDLYEASFNDKWIKAAIELTNIQINLFYDTVNHGFFDTNGSDKSLLMRTKEWVDNAEPSGNSIAVFNLLRLAQMTDNKYYEEIAEKSLEYFSNSVNQYPDAMVSMLCTLDFSITKPKQIIVAGSISDPQTTKILELINESYIPNKIVVLINKADKNGTGKFFPIENYYVLKNDKTTVYICEDYHCKLPTSDLDEIKNLLV